MNRSKSLYVLKALGAGTLFAVLLTSCAAMGKPPEQQVTERAQERLDLFLAGDFAQSYEYLSPGYRSSVSVLEYQRKSAATPMAWSDASIVESDCVESTCKLKISMDIVVYGAVPGASKFETKAVATENWIKSDGTWYMVPSD